MVENQDYLLPDVRKLLDLSNEERIHYIEKDTWIGYPRAKKALKKLNELLQHSERLRMPNLLIIGSTNNGKSMIIEKFLRDNPPIRGANSMGISEVLLEMPVLSLQMPTGPEIKRFFLKILSKLEQRETPGRWGVPHLERRFYELFQKRKVKMIIIDEIHNILAGSSKQQLEFLNLLRFIGNELRVPIVCVGTKDAYLAIRTDPQLENRFEPFPIPIWRTGDDFDALLASFVAIFPLKKQSNFTQDDVSDCILKKTEGIIGEIATLLRRASTHAVLSGTEKINRSLLESVEYYSPNDRRKIFEKQLA